MSVIGLFFIPLDPAASSPFTTLSQHIARNLSAQPLPPFWLEYRLLIDTSSLLPGALETRKRRSTHCLTLGHFPEKTYVLTEPEKGERLSLIAVPNGAVSNSFFSMVTTKMNPLWAARSEFRIDNGTAVDLSEGEVAAVRVGELKVTVGQGAGKVRGVVIELRLRENEEQEVETDVAAREGALRAALEVRFRGSGVNLSNAKVVCKASSDGKEGTEPGEVIRLYAELMKVAALATQR